MIKITESQRQHFSWIDTLRFIAIVLMVIGHSGAPTIITNFIYGFHMPLFFVLSGFLYNDCKWRQRGWHSFIKSRFNSYIIPYILWGIVNLIVNALYELSHTPNILGWLFSQGKHLFWLIYSFGGVSNLPNCTPLWFLPCLFISSLMLFGLMRMSTPRIRATILMCAVFFVIAETSVVWFRLPWHIEAAVLGCFFMYLGGILKTVHIKLKWILITIVVSSACVLLNGRVDLQSYTFGNPLLYLLGSIGLSCTILLAARDINYQNTMLIRLGGGKNTIIFIALNYVINTYVRLVFNYFELPFYWWMDIFVVVVICSYIAYRYGNGISALYNKFKV